MEGALLHKDVSIEAVPRSIRTKKDAKDTENNRIK